MYILEQLIQIRKEKKITQKEVAKHIGVNKITVGRYENRIRAISGEQLIKYADLLGYELRLLKK